MSDPQTAVYELLRLTSEGLSVNSLGLMEEKCTLLLVSGYYPLVFYVLESVFSDLRADWANRPLFPLEQRQAQERVGRPVETLLRLILTDAGDKLVIAQLETVVRGFVALRAAG